MTGFGRAVVLAGRCSIAAEARSVNQKGLHVSVSLPDQLASMEQDIRDEIRKRYSRGRIDLRLTVEAAGSSGDALPVDFERAGKLAEAAALIAARLGLDGGISALDLMRLPGVLRASSEPEAPDAGPVLECVASCLDDLTRSRRAEGEALAALMSEHLTRIGSLASEVAAIQQEAVPEAFERMRERVGKLLGDSSRVDEQRLLQELAVMADRLDVCEELERLGCHVSSALDLASSDEPDAGRKLGFLLQELQREINTLGAKLETPAGTMIVVEMKNELSSLREQAANVE
ncbi:MAG TPA: YicC family protein [Candidatus Fermentibacter daniensis]|jgi:uncharacterized protein (TIGR00255 family)|nr:MAG: hypothetical protein AO395_03655 [Candidatus Fermentibacter daniensis]MBP7719487.1 YicC family protein [Candidatus Fermentibacter sp.]OQC70491.1 MAG: hypothetical protein BWX47_00329 [candidate division Hyd24-12 bacterium ADurb.Bin004]KZD17816.1 MAG: hypothetical protein AO394_04710 [Candidatus Fermentibacter daniensis]KZD18704.1 MAG: hypothetical protein AO396_00165 [Candidatus Fermentibacter daniensis]